MHCKNIFAILQIIKANKNKYQAEFKNNWKGFNMIQVLSTAAHEALLFDSSLKTAIDIARGVVAIHKTQDGDYMIDLWEDPDIINEPFSVIISTKSESELLDYIIEKKRSFKQRLEQLVSKLETSK